MGNLWQILLMMIIIITLFTHVLVLGIHKSTRKWRILAVIFINVQTLILVCR